MLFRRTERGAAIRAWRVRVQTMFQQRGEEGFQSVNGGGNADLGQLAGSFFRNQFRQRFRSQIPFSSASEGTSNRVRLQRQGDSGAEWGQFQGGTMPC